ncbi:MAG: hypothetical protein H0W68_00230 [Gemmatimonadaceae bacterium]|nr:hypothetical protein [Gemmatimonadaceae bacterium]
MAPGIPRILGLATIALLTSLALLPPAALAQSDTTSRDSVATPEVAITPAGESVVLVLRDGSQLLGRVTEVTAVTVRFVSAVGESTIPRTTIVKARRVIGSSLHGGEYWPENPSRTRLFFAPTGRMLRKGEVYLSDAYIFLPSIQGGLTDRFTMGGGFSIFPGLGIDEQLFYLTPKVGLIASPTVNVAVGALVAGARFATKESPFGVGYGVATVGGEDASVTLGAGLGFSRGSSSSLGLFMLGGERRVAKALALVTESYVVAVNGAHVLGSFGVRFLGEHIAVDLAAVGFSGGTPFPYLSFVYKW